MSKISQRISRPGSSKFPQKGPHNPNVGTSGSGLAPKPSGGAALLGNDRPSNPTTANLARVTDSPMGDSALRLPVHHPTANIANRQVGQAEADPGGPGISMSPQTRMPVTRNPVASGKPKRKGLGSAFFGEY